MYLADSAQVPRVQLGRGVLELKLHEVPTTDSSQVHRVQVRLRFGVLELGRGVLELKLHEEESKYTEA